MESENGTNRDVEVVERKIIRNLKSSRDANDRWTAGVWERIVRFANGTGSTKDDDANTIALHYQLCGFPYAEGTDVTHALEVFRLNRKTLEARIVAEAHTARPAVREILRWIARPGEYPESDRRTVETISRHNNQVRSGFKLLDGRLVNQWFEVEHGESNVLLAFICRFVLAGLKQIDKNLVRLPEPSPIRTCGFAACQQFLVRDGKTLFCKEHRGKKGSRCPEENRRYKYTRDNLSIQGDLRTRIRKLNRKIERLQENLKARDRAWKLQFLTKTRDDTIRENAEKSARRRSGGQVAPK